MSSIAAPVFDAAQYKQTTREQWERAAKAWHRWAPLLERWLGPATELMLDLAGVSEGDRVLDVAAGAGGQTIAAARRVGVAGSVLATDISPAILSYAQQEVRRAGLGNVAVRELDGELLDVEPGQFDAVISRVGLIYFPDRVRATERMRRALRPGGRVAAIVYSTAERNAFFSVPVSIIRRRAQLPPPSPGQPGPFSLGSPGALAELFDRAGLVEIETRTLEAPVCLPSAAECVRFERESFGALHQMLAGLSDAEREEAWSEIEQELTSFEDDSGFVGPCELVVGVGMRP